MGLLLAMRLLRMRPGWSGHTRRLRHGASVLVLVMGALTGWGPRPSLLSVLHVLPVATLAGVALASSPIRIAMPILVALANTSLLHGVADHALHVTRQGLQDLRQAEVKLVATRNLIPVIGRTVALLIHDSELLEIAPVLRLLQLDVTDLLQLVVVDLDARHGQRQLLLCPLRLVRRLEADEGTGEVCVGQDLDALYLTE